MSNKECYSSNWCLIITQLGLHEKPDRSDTPDADDIQFLIWLSKGQFAFKVLVRAYAKFIFIVSCSGFSTPKGFLFVDVL